MKTVNFLCMAALALVGAVITGCSAEDPIDSAQSGSNVVTLTTTVGLDDGISSRALASDGTKTFAEGETIAVIYQNTSSTTVKAVSVALTASDISDEGKSATFTVTLTNPDNSQDVTYIYPAAMANDDGSANYAALAAQDGTLATLSSTLDYCTASGAWSGDDLPALTLENQLAILAITLKNSDGSSDITSTITGVNIYDGTNSYAVTRSAAAGPIYVAIQPTSSAYVVVTATSGSVNYNKALSAKTYAANNGYSVSWRMNTVPDPLSGKFTASSGQVQFAQGNLQAVFASAGSSCTWKFAENQWDYVGNAAANTSIDAGTVTAAGTVDLFGWVGASSTLTGLAQYGITKSSTTNSTNGYGNVKIESLKSDWGTLMGTSWRSLSFEEWQYLLFNRSTGGTVGETSSARYTQATINTDGTSVKGLILFPDGVDFASDEFSALGTVNGASDWGTTCTSAQWTALAAKGCVFLPAAGHREGASVSDVNSLGWYWSSTYSDAEVSRALGVIVVSNYVDQPDIYRRIGCSVRLACPAN